MVGYHLGVDLGTAFVAAAVSANSCVQMITLGERAVVTPAVVFLRDDDTFVCGDSAARRAVSNPERSAKGFRHRLGDPTAVMLAGNPFPIVVLLAALLRDAVTRVTDSEGVEPASVVLTRPASWGPFRQEMFDAVPQLAGLTEAVRTVTEAEAAATHYAGSRQLRYGEIIAVFDLGAYTVDATILRKHRDGFEILGVPAQERLGGVDFDELIQSYVNDAASNALAEIDTSDPQTGIALARLREDCILAKEALSIDTETTIPVLLPNRQLVVRLTRADFERMIRGPVESTIGTLARALLSAQVDPGRLSAVLLAGDSSRVPLVSRMISEELRRPTVVDVHPKHSVARGAAMLAR
jgi:molecular chaperone DnaK (HSP70)